VASVLPSGEKPIGPPLRVLRVSMPLALYMDDHVPIAITGGSADLFLRGTIG
jgi:hypothetical protein